MDRSDAPSSGHPHRWEYHVSPGETLSAVLSRIRGTPGSELFLDISDHEPLRTDGALRRTLAAAAAEMGKRVTFSMSGSPRASEGRERVVSGSPRASEGRERVVSGSPRVPPLRDGHRRSGTPPGGGEWVGRGSRMGSSAPADQGRSPQSAAVPPPEPLRPLARGASVPVTVVQKTQTAAAGGPPRVPREPLPPSGLRGPGREDWRGIGFSVPRLSSTGRRVALTFTFLAGLLATAAVIFLVPRAEVVITPSIEPINADLTVRASTGVTRVDPADGVLPTQVISLEKTVEGTFPVEYVVEHGERARGAIELVNRTGSEQRIRGGSRLEAPHGVVVRMEEAAVVPPRGTVRVTVTAQDGGTKGNLREGQLTFVALPSDTRTILFGRVVEPLSGGTDRPVPTLAEEDIRRAAEKLVADAQDALRENIRGQLPPGTLLRDELIRVRVAEAAARESVGSERKEFHFVGRLRGEAFTLSISDLQNLLQAMALKRTEGQKTLGKPLATDVVKVADVRWEDGTVEMTARIENVAHEAFDLDSLKERLAGRTRDGAVEYLRALPGVKEAEVTLSPFWIRRVPGIPRNVQIELRLP